MASTVAQQWIAMLSKDQSRPQSVALSGGRSAQALFHAVVAQLTCDIKTSSTAHHKPTNDQQPSGAGPELNDAPRALPSPVPPFQEVHFFWADERCVAPHHNESNYGLANKLLLEPLAIPPHQIHRIEGELDVHAASHHAEQVIRNFFGSRGIPVLDLVFLGMGEDGHIASLFPGHSKSIVTSPTVYCPVQGSKPPHQRITLTYQALTAAQQIWILVCGPGKQSALQASLKGTTTPLGHLLALRTKPCRIWVASESM